MKKILSLIVIALLTFSCSNKEDVNPQSNNVNHSYIIKLNHLSSYTYRVECLKPFKQLDKQAVLQSTGKYRIEGTDIGLTTFNYTFEPNSTVTVSASRSNMYVVVLEDGTEIYRANDSGLGNLVYTFTTK